MLFLNQTKTVSCFLILLLLFFSTHLYGDSWSFFLRHRKELFYSDPQEVAIDLTYIERNKIKARVGNYLNFLRYEKIQKAYQAGIDAYMTIYFHGADAWETPVDSLDGRVALYTDFEQGPLYTKLSIEHISAHLSDGRFRGTSQQQNAQYYLFEIRDGFSAYSREFAKWMIAYHLWNTKFYGGFLKLLRIKEPVELQEEAGIGYQLGFEKMLQGEGAPFGIFFSSDLQWKEEYNFLLNQNHHFGISLSGLRLFFNYYRGFDQRGVYWDKQDRYLGMGVSLPL